MRQPALLFAAALFAALAVGCSGGGGGVVVRVETPLPATALPSPTPGPSPTPIPPPELVLSALQVPQAGTVLASVTGEITGGTVTFLGAGHDLIQGSQSMYTFIGIGTDDPPGEHELVVDFTLANGTEGSLTETISVYPNDWTVEYLEFTPEVSTLLDPQIARDEAALLAEVYGRESAEKLWDGPWITPAPGMITARFGEQRSINGGPVAGHHGGTDISGDPGTPVLATSSGTVVLAKQLQIHGNMVVIDHGGGLLSGYAHLSGFAVAEGQTVAAGEVIAYIGNTGLSTGAHLHWEMAVHGVLVDALFFVDGTNGF